MSPKPKHIPDDAYRTTLRLTDEDLAAINWIRTSRRQKGNDRKTINDVLVDGIWSLLRNEEGKTREEIKATIPRRPAPPNNSPDKITEMPKSGNLNQASRKPKVSNKGGLSGS
jgi:hypothetical protein